MAESSISRRIMLSPFLPTSDDDLTDFVSRFTNKEKFNPPMLILQANSMYSKIKNKHKEVNHL